jgi:hypothetical protein
MTTNSAERTNYLIEDSVRAAGMALDVTNWHRNNSPKSKVSQRHLRFMDKVAAYSKAHQSVSHHLLSEAYGLDWEHLLFFVLKYGRYSSLPAPPQGGFTEADFCLASDYKPVGEWREMVQKNSVWMDDESSVGLHLCGNLKTDNAPASASSLYRRPKYNQRQTRVEGRVGHGTKGGKLAQEAPVLTEFYEQICCLGERPGQKWDEFAQADCGRRVWGSAEEQMLDAAMVLLASRVRDGAVTVIQERSARLLLFVREMLHNVKVKVQKKFYPFAHKRHKLSGRKKRQSDRADSERKAKMRSKNLVN